MNGNGRNPNIEDILETAKNIGLNYDKAKKIAEKIRKIVKEDLGKII